MLALERTVVNLVRSAAISGRVRPIAGRQKPANYRDGIWVQWDPAFAGRTLARFLVAASFGVAGEFATFALPATTLPDVDLRGPADGLNGNFFVTALLSAAVFAVAVGFRAVETAGLAAFFAVTLPADGLLRPAAGLAGG